MTACPCAADSAVPCRVLSMYSLTYCSLIMVIGHPTNCRPGLAILAGQFVECHIEFKTSHSFPASIIRGRGIRPSFTSSSNFEGEMPRYIAASVRARPRRGTGLDCDGESDLAVMSPPHIVQAVAKRPQRRLVQLAIDQDCSCALNGGCRFRQGYDTATAQQPDQPRFIVAGQAAIAGCA